MLDRTTEAVNIIKMVRNLLLLFALICFSQNLFAEPTEIFAIQIGSYKQFAEETRKAVVQYGEVHILTYKELSRVTVGEFSSRQAATAQLQKLKDAGFADAFIRQIGYADLNKVQSTIEKFNVLVSEMDAQVFYLDDYKYIFEGSGYIQMPRNLEVDGIKLDQK